MDPSKCHKTGPDYDHAECAKCDHLVEIGVWSTVTGDRFVCFETGDCKYLNCSVYSGDPLERESVFHISHENAIRSFAEKGARFCESPLDAAGSEE
jgi:hypothetical protein